jgi:hypothetical protein
LLIRKRPKSGRALIELRAWKLALRNGRSLWWRSGHVA